MAGTGLDIHVNGLDRVQTYLASLNGKLTQAFTRGMYSAALLVERRAKEKLSGEVLHVRTGRLWSSVTSSVSETMGGEMEGRVGSNVVYARIHELGGVTGRHHATTIPARPYLRPSAEEQIPEIRDVLGREIAAAIQPGAP